MPAGRDIIMASGRGPTGFGHIFIQQKEAANQLHPDDMIMFAANGESEQVQRRATQLQKHRRQIRVYSPSQKQRKTQAPTLNNTSLVVRFLTCGIKSSHHYSLFSQRSYLIRKRPPDRQTTNCHLGWVI